MKAEEMNQSRKIILDEFFEIESDIIDQNQKCLFLSLSRLFFLFFYLISFCFLLKFFEINTSLSNHSSTVEVPTTMQRLKQNSSR